MSDRRAAGEFAVGEGPKDLREALAKVEAYARSVGLARHHRRAAAADLRRMWRDALPACLPGQLPCIGLLSVGRGHMVLSVFVTGEAEPSHSGSVH